MKNFFITTLGCKVNQYESDGIAAELESNGWKRKKESKKAEICIINTCAVTSKAAMQSRQTIRSIIRANPDAEIIVTGCHAQTAPDEIKKIRGVHCITGHKDKFNIAEAVLLQEQKFPGLTQNRNNKKPNGELQNNGPQEKNKKIKKNAEQTKSTLLPFPESNQCTDNRFYSFSPAVTGNMTRAYLKIQDGCNAFCTYCIVPYARGRSCSMPENDVIEHLESLRKQGYAEAVITGIHTGMYGLDFKKKSSFFRLIKKIDELKPIHRIRLSSIEPKELTDDIIELAAETSTICDHFHIPLQSGDDEILKRMKRPYNTDFFRNIIHKIHSLMPYAAIGVDILQGFPGESEKAFKNTHDLIKDLPVSYLHVFPFSPRKGTPAFDYPDKIKPEILKYRCSIMRKLGKEKKMQFIKNNIGRKIESVIQNRRDRETGMLNAVTSNYLTILVRGEDQLKRKIVEIMPERLESDNIITGKII